MNYYYRLVGLYLFFTLLIAFISYGQLPNGIRIFTNTKSSMEPLISPNSLTIVKPLPHYNEKDIISYYHQENDQTIIVTHRVLQISGNVYITKGDFNQAIDKEIVKPRLVIGKVIFIIPWAGLILSIIKSFFGTIIFIIMPAITIIYIEINKICHN